MKSDKPHFKKGGVGKVLYSSLIGLSIVDTGRMVGFTDPTDNVFKSLTSVGVVSAFTF